MESALVVPQPRLIEYPNDLSGCDFVDLEGKRLLYLCSHSDGGRAFIVVLGFYCGQKEDIVVKDLIEPVEEGSRNSVIEVLPRSLTPEYSDAHVFFL